MTDQAAELLTVPDVATFLKLSRRSVERLIASGQLPVIRLSLKTTRIERSALLAYVRSKAA